MPELNVVLSTRDGMSLQNVRSESRDSITFFKTLSQSLPVDDGSICTISIQLSRKDFEPEANITDFSAVGYRVIVEKVTDAT